MRVFTEFEKKRLTNFLSAQPVTEESMKDIKLANGKTYINSNLMDNWLSFHKSGVRCRMNFGYHDIVAQIKGLFDIV